MSAPSSECAEWMHLQSGVRGASAANASSSLLSAPRARVQMILHRKEVLRSNTSAHVNQPSDQEGRRTHQPAQSFDSLPPERLRSLLLILLYLSWTVGTRLSSVRPSWSRWTSSGPCEAGRDRVSVGVGRGGKRGGRDARRRSGGCGRLPTSAQAGCPLLEEEGDAQQRGGAGGRGELRRSAGGPEQRLRG